MTPLSELIRSEIRQQGPIPFSRFMEIALYHPELGYYRRERDPFGRSGDFFTAEQVQPVFGRLISQYARALSGGVPSTVVELGAGRREMAEYFAAWEYIPVDIGYGSMPDSFAGLVFANEFLDALPVDVVVRREGELRHVRVACRADAFEWVDAEPVSAAVRSFLADSAGTLDEGVRIEVNPRALEWLDRIAASLEHGHALFIDYGYTAREAIRFPEGTLMSYHRHTALVDVLGQPGERDITAHVPFSAVQAHARRTGWEEVRFESMAALLLRAGEQDHFASALAAADEREALALRMKLKTLLFGMGETFRTLLLRR